MEWDWIDDVEEEDEPVQDDYDYHLELTRGPIKEIEGGADGDGDDDDDNDAEFAPVSVRSRSSTKRKIRTSRSSIASPLADSPGVARNTRGARKKRCSDGGGRGNDEDEERGTPTSLNASPAARRSPTPPAALTRRRRRSPASRSPVAVKHEPAADGAVAGDDDGDTQPLAAVKPEAAAEEEQQLLLEAGQFVAVAADSHDEPFFLARLEEPVGAATPPPPPPPPPPSTEQADHAADGPKPRRGPQRGAKSKSQQQLLKQEETSSSKAAMVRVRWLNHRPSRGAHAGAFEEFVEADEGAVPVDSIMCRVYPEPLSRAAGGGNGWRLGRRDKLRIFRVRVDAVSPVEWLTSHLLPDRIIWSSHPDLLKPDIAFDFSAEEQFLQNNEDEDEEGPKQPSTTTTTTTTAAACGVDDAAEAEKLFKRAARMLKEAPAVLVMAGAGMGKDSGLPDYRGAQGFWRSYPPLARLGITFNESMDPTWFKKDPHQAWGFYGHRAELYGTTTPHAGFEVLRRLSETKADNFFVATSNIDEQFQKAGFPQGNIYECHGSLGYLQCVRPCGKHIWPLAADQIPRVDMETLRVPERDDESAFPRCQSCGDIARPNVSLAADTQDTWVEGRSLEQKRRLLRWLKRVMRGAEDGDQAQEQQHDAADSSDASQLALSLSSSSSSLSLSSPSCEQSPQKRQHSFLHEDQEDFERLDEWREIRVKRKRKSGGAAAAATATEAAASQPAEEDEQAATAAKTAPSARQPRRKSAAKLVVVELGCGDSLHSLRIEAELMIRENPSVKLIRINPNFRGKMKRGHIAMKMGALEALLGIGKHLRCNPPESAPRPATTPVVAPSPAPVVAEASSNSSSTMAPALAPSLSAPSYSSPMEASMSLLGAQSAARPAWPVSLPPGGASTGGDWWGPHAPMFAWGPLTAAPAPPTPLPPLPLLPSSSSPPMPSPFFFQFHHYGPGCPPP